MEDAITAYETLLRLYPDHFWGTSNLARAYRWVGRGEKAGTLFLRQADLRPQNLQVVASAAMQAM